MKATASSLIIHLKYVALHNKIQIFLTEFIPHFEEEKKYKPVKIVFNFVLQMIYFYFKYHNIISDLNPWNLLLQWRIRLMKNHLWQLVLWWIQIWSNSLITGWGEQDQRAQVFASESFTWEIRLKFLALDSGWLALAIVAFNLARELANGKSFSLFFSSSL